MFKIVRGDLTKLPESVDVIINSADHDVQVNFGTDRAVYEAAGMEKLLAARAKIGIIEIGEAAITDSFDLREKTKKIIHAVAPIWKNGNNLEYDDLKRCYRNALNLALIEGLKRIAVPVLSSGNNQFPKDDALRIAVEQIIRFLFKHDDFDITLVIFDKEIFDKCRRIFKVKQYIKNNEVKEIQNNDSAKGVESFRESQLKRNFEIDKTTFLRKFSEILSKKGLSLYEDDDLKKVLYEGHISQRVFYSIRNTKTYKPSKQTAIRLAFALQLSAKETQELLNSAGHVLYEQNHFDNEIIKLLEQQINITEVENELEKKGLSL